VRPLRAIGPLTAVLSISSARTAPAQATRPWGGVDVAAGAFAWRHPGDRSVSWHDGLELAWGPSLAAREGAFHFTGLVQMDLRAFDASSWALAISTHGFEVATHVGPLVPYVRAGAALLTLDDFAGNFSAELFSPRVGAGVGMQVARRLEVAIGAYAEYFWRWFGPSALVHGVVLDVRYEKPMRQK
jgi:hypothetical protein